MQLAETVQPAPHRAQPAEHIASHPPLSAPFPAAHRIPHPARRNATQRVRVWAPRSTPTLHLACAEPARTPSCSAALADAENLQPGPRDRMYAHPQRARARARLPLAASICAHRTASACWARNETPPPTSTPMYAPLSTASWASGRVSPRPRTPPTLSDCNRT
ncbi:hypothetical protein CERSUDRAFT_87280, partial [Gelatoporia subvermispora B]